MLKKLFGWGKKKEVLTVYPGSVAADMERARQLMQNSRSGPRSLRDILEPLPSFVHSAPIQIRGKSLGRGKVVVKYGLVHPPDLAKAADAKIINCQSSVDRRPVIAIFQGTTPLHVEVLSNEILDLVDERIVGVDKVHSRTRDYRIDHSGRVAALLKLLK